MIKKRTKIVTLEFIREELLYDISQYGFVEGDVMKTDDEHDRHQVIDIIEDGNIDLVTRRLDLALAKCVELLYPYSKLPVDNITKKDDTLKYTDVYTVKLLVPDDFSQTTVELLTWLIHNLLVYYVLEHWMSITNIVNPASKENWKNKIKDTEDEIKSSLNARVGRVRKTQTPF